LKWPKPNAGIMASIILITQTVTQIGY